MTVELPKDAEGREIPLDTALLYGKVSGDEYEVVCFSFSPSMRQWRVKLKRRDDLGIYATESFTLSQPDSLEKLAEDLNRAWDVGNAQEKGCRYMPCYYGYYDKGRGAHCNDCRLNSNGKMNCLDAMMADIISRVNRLAGDSE